MKFSGKIIISDIDGTYTGSDEGVKKNNEAIEYFKANGGLFTFASGRVEHSINNIVPGFFDLINAPAVMSNGSYLYDKITDKRINEICVDAEKVLPILKGLKAVIPQVGIRINVGKSFITPELTEAAYNDAKQYDPHEVPFDKMTLDGWNKIVLIGERSYMKEVEDYVKNNGGYGFAVSYSCPVLLEILDKNATKGNQVKYLKRMLGGVETYCCGDFENDEDMLKHADHAVAPSSGMEKIKKMAEIVTCGCEEGAIAYLVDYLDKSTK